MIDFRGGAWHLQSMPRPDHCWVSEAAPRFALRYEEGRALIEGVAAQDIVERVGTPTYAYSAGHITRQFRRLAEAVAARPTLICFAVKSNSSQAVLRLLGQLGAGADIVSGGELARALAAGIPSDRIVFSGVGKTDEEIDTAIRAKVKSINIESVAELERVAKRAAALGTMAPVCLRVNPDVDPATHPYLATGLQESKFGIAMKDALPMALRAHDDPNLDLCGLACHIGSQIVDVAPFVDAFARMKGLIEALSQAGVRLRQLDLGGGFGIAYGENDRELDIPAWGKAVVEATRDFDLELVIEPGRSLVAQAGVLLTRVLFNKAGEKRSFVVVDAAMNDLLRPSLYRGYHAIVPLRLPPADAPAGVVDVVGPICESGDFLAKDRPLAQTSPGDALAVLSAGAYGMVMASNYNTRPVPAEVLVHDDDFHVIRPRKTVEQLIGEDIIPEWLGGEPREGLARAEPLARDDGGSTSL